MPNQYILVARGKVDQAKYKDGRLASDKELTATLTSIALKADGTPEWTITTKATVDEGVRGFNVVTPKPGGSRGRAR